MAKMGVEKMEETTMMTKMKGEKMTFIWKTVLRFLEYFR
jgi:hypothetical protein